MAFDERKSEIDALMAERRIGFSGHNPGGRYISLCAGKYELTLTDYNMQGDLERLAAWIETVDWAEVAKFYGK